MKLFINSIDFTNKIKDINEIKETRNKITTAKITLIATGDLKKVIETTKRATIVLNDNTVYEFIITDTDFSDKSIIKLTLIGFGEYNLISNNTTADYRLDSPNVFNTVKELCSSNLDGIEPFLVEVATPSNTTQTTSYFRAEKINRLTALKRLMKLSSNEWWFNYNNFRSDSNPKLGTYSLHFKNKYEDVLYLPKKDTLFKIDQPLSISAWVYLTSFTTPHCSIFSDLMPANDDYGGVELSILNSGKVLFYLFGGHATGGNWFNNSITVTTQDTINLNTYYHIVVTYDGGKDASGVHIYINNVDKTLDINYNTLTDDKVDYYQLTHRVGGRFKKSFIDGYLDDFRFFTNYELSSSDVSTLYNSGNGTTNSIGNKESVWYLFNDYSNYRVKDISNNNMDGYLTGEPYFNYNPSRGDGTVKKTYYTYGTQQNAIINNKKTDISKWWNKVKVLGFGDGLRQIESDWKMDTTSINTYKITSEKIWRDSSIKTYSDANELATNILNDHKDPIVNIDLDCINASPIADNINVGDKITIKYIDNILGENDSEDYIIISRNIDMIGWQPHVVLSCANKIYTYIDEISHELDESENRNMQQINELQEDTVTDDTTAQYNFPDSTGNFLTGIDSDTFNLPNNVSSFITSLAGQSIWEGNGSTYNFLTSTSTGNFYSSLSTCGINEPTGTGSGLITGSDTGTIQYTDANMNSHSTNTQATTKTSEAITSYYGEVTKTQNSWWNGHPSGQEWVTYIATNQNDDHNFGTYYPYNTEKVVAYIGFIIQNAKDNSGYTINGQSYFRMRITDGSNYFPSFAGALIGVYINNGLGAGFATITFHGDIISKVCKLEGAYASNLLGTSGIYNFDIQFKAQLVFITKHYHDLPSTGSNILVSDSGVGLRSSSGITVDVNSINTTTKYPFCNGNTSAAVTSTNTQSAQASSIQTTVADDAGAGTANAYSSAVSHTSGSNTGTFDTSIVSTVIQNVIDSLIKDKRVKTTTG